jgi:hypothetical protein
MLAVRPGGRAGTVEWCLGSGVWPVGWPSPGFCGVRRGWETVSLGSRDAAEES